MTTTLSEGVKVPDVGSVNWAGDLEVNWNLLNGALANLSGNVKLDRDNIWTGEQSFTLPIVGSITGTASKAIADEDGTSIKTGYGKLAGANTWTNANTYTNNFYFKDSTVVKGTAVTSDRAQNIWDVTDSSNVSFGTWQAVQYSNNRQGFRLCVSNNYLNGALDTTGTSIPTFFQFLQTGGSAILKWNDGFVDNNVLPIANSNYSLGSAYFRWSSVYADTYYYGTTAWGLDKANVWTNSNTFNGSTNTVVTLQRGGSSYYSDIRFTDETSHILGCIRVSTELLIGYQRSSSWVDGSRIILKNNGSLQFGLNDGTNTNNIIANATEIKPTNAVADLGTSTNKWKTLNGINPGALSLPDFTSETGVSLSAGANTYTPVLSGWLSISTTGDISVVCGNFCHKATDMISVPVIAGKTYTVTMPSAATGYFYSCLGNV